jgi:leucyl/phenylalanyl-tRNA---protein transferase
MAARDALNRDITPQVLLKAYSCGIFPMAESADDPQLYWIEPISRGILPLDDIRLPKRLARTIRQQPFDVRVDTDFDATIAGCAASRPGRRTTWINDQIRSLYRELYILGHCHTVEVWNGKKMVGGLYGVALGGAFFGESMFSTETDASKIALVYLCARLIRGGFTLLDTQFVTDHLRQFGTIEVDRPDFHKALEAAIPRTCDYKLLAADAPPAEIIDIIERAQAGKPASDA